MKIEANYLLREGTEEEQWVTLRGEIIEGCEGDRVTPPEPEHVDPSSVEAFSAETDEGVELTWKEQQEGAEVLLNYGW